jgi:DNA-binding NarL/FixJ family response regulator
VTFSSGCAPIEILVVDDDDLLCDYLSKLLTRGPGMTVIGCATSGEQAIESAARLRPRVIIMDLNLPVVNGLQATRQILAVRPDTRIIILSAGHTSELVMESWRAGALAYVLKQSAAAELADAIRAVVAGRYYLCRAIDDAPHNASKQSVPPR